ATSSRPQTAQPNSSTDRRGSEDMINEWFHTAGTLARDGFASVVAARSEGWAHTGFRSVTLGDASVLAVPSAPAGTTAGGTLPTSIDLPAAAVERVIVPLAGETFTVDYTPTDGTTGSQELSGQIGRASRRERGEVTEE